MRTLIVFLAAFLLAPPAGAQMVCGERGEFIKHLKRQYDERPVAMGLVSNGAVIEVLTSPGGSWTILATNPDGITCVVAAGEAWETVSVIREET